ncbi:hypothetical protein KC318_g654 [Hortaea werneckii]|nr:hypothetical protein KC334_g746 [Hortaea werneckii]KAI7026248.1 hypothetical protein KC355_g706 [Hortaea werneckii]KAI7675881.1 hypothetical protein KC318_g654 [Hortaea werneckii]
MAPTLDHSTPLIIVGAGVFGLSSAWWLAHAGYCNIKVLDRWPVPSPSSAGYDRNKIVRTEYPDDIYSVLSQEAIHLWRDPLWKDVFHPTGWIYGTDGSQDQDREKTFLTAVSNTRSLGDPSKIVELPSWGAAFNLVPALAYAHEHRKAQVGTYTGGKPTPPEGTPTFRGVYNGNAGWVESTNAMLAMKRECERLGVEFIAGESGTVVDFVRKSEDPQTVVGVRTANGAVWYSDKVIVAAGAYSETLLDFKGQLQASGYCVTHIRMTEQQYQRYKNIPVINIARRGYCFPPNEDRIFKICNLDITVVNNERWAEPSCDWGVRSIPRDQAYNPTDTQPRVGREKTLEFARYILPELGHAEVESSKVCWDVETHDDNWIIGYHDSAPQSLFIATGGSGYTFKNMPNIGKYVTEALEGRLDSDWKDLWRWRPDRVGVYPEREARNARFKFDLRDCEGWRHTAPKI